MSNFGPTKALGLEIAGCSWRSSGRDCQKRVILAHVTLLPECSVANELKIPRVSLQTPSRGEPRGPMWSAGAGTWVYLSLLGSSLLTTQRPPQQCSRDLGAPGCSTSTLCPWPRLKVSLGLSRSRNPGRSPVSSACLLMLVQGAAMVVSGLKASDTCSQCERTDVLLVLVLQR